jgi:hypothetical protein
VGRAGFVVWLVAVLVVIGETVMLFSITTGLVLGNAIAGDLTVHASIDTLPQVSQFLMDGDGGDLTTVDLRIRLLCASPVLVDLVTVLLAAGLVTRIINRIGAGDSFAPDVPRRWRQLSAVLFAGGILQGVLNTLAVSIIQADPQAVLAPRAAADVSVTAIGFGGSGWPWMLLVLAVIAGALAVAFRQGSRLQEDIDGVI